MELQRIPIKPEQLQNIPPSERALAIVLSHALNEINTIHKLIFLCTNFENGHQCENDAHVSQALILVRTLVGKMYEAWGIFQKGYFATRLSQIYDKELDPDTLEKLSKLKKYFSQKNSISIIRHEFAFHYSLEQAKTAIPRDIESEELAIYLHTTDGNTLYQFADIIMTKALTYQLDKGNLDATLQFMFDEISAVVGWINNSFQGILFLILEKHIGLELLKISTTNVDIGPAPLSSSIKIPFFVEVVKK